MRRFGVLILLVLFSLLKTQAQSWQEIDSLVNKMRTVHKEWSIYAEALEKIGEPAVPGLIENATDKDLKQWNRRVSIETLNRIHSERWVKPALEILFDDKEVPDLRNRVTAGLRGFDLSGQKEKLWSLFKETENTFYKSNLAHLLITADKELAYRAFQNIYETTSGHVQTSALLNLVHLRPDESQQWYLKALQGDDWRTANLAMDSLIVSDDLQDNMLLACYRNHEAKEEIQWRVVHLLGQRKEDTSIPFLCSALRNKSWLVRTEAAVALCRFNRELVIKELDALKNDTVYYVRANSEWVIQQLR